MTEDKTTGTKDKLDETVAETFPASDPPANTPVEGDRKAERLRDGKET